jgi:hypothetical protein
MSFVGDPFRHDVFVSYSHGDILSDGDSPLKLWSQSFVRELKRELQLDINAAVSLFLDENPRRGEGVDGMAPLAPQLQAIAETSAILAVLMTPQYLGSSWCRQELDWWVEGQRKCGIPHQSRIAVARILPTATNIWPSALGDDAGNQHVGVHFFNRAGGSGVRPFGWPAATSSTGGEFREAVVSLAGLIQARLREVRALVGSARQREEELRRLTAPAGQAIYLHGRESQALAWDRARRDLVDEGFAVFPLQPEPVDTEPKRIRERSARRVSVMQGCDAVLLLGTDDGGALESDLPSIGRFDRYQAIAGSNRLLPCSVLDTVGIVGREPILKQIAANICVDWIDATAGPWPPRVRSWLKEAIQ